MRSRYSGNWRQWGSGWKARLLISAMLLVICACFASASDDSNDLLNASPPKNVEGDDEPVETTYGTMRVALWWYDYAQELRTAYVGLADDYRLCRKDATDFVAALDEKRTQVVQLQKAVRLWQTCAIISFTVAATAAGVITLLAVLPRK